jgi:hypothetical protein
MSATRTLRRNFVLQAILSSVLVASATACVAAENEGESYEKLSSATAPHVPTRIINTVTMPIQRGSSSTGWGIQMLYENPEGGGLRLLYVPPGAEGAKVHYHDFHEWAYNVDGDFTNNESTMPDQVYGPLQRFRAGDFLSRPPYSLHGGERDRMKHMASQVGAIILIMEESGVSGGTWCIDPDCRNQSEDAPGMKYNPNWREIQHWSTPRIIDTWDDMPWQPMEEYPGLNVKYLVEDPSHGFRARMWFLEAGAATPDFMLPHYYKEAHMFTWVINGDLKLQTYSDPETPAETFTVEQRYMVDRAPMSIYGLPAEGATQGGVVWLEVTYAKGTTWTAEPTPIESPTHVTN